MAAPTDPMSMLLSREELHAITGAKIPSKIKQLLGDHGILFINRLDGWPATTWAAVNAALGGNATRTEQDEEPDLSFLVGHQ